MATKIIPMQAILICDACEKDHNRTTFRQSGKLHIKRDGLDYQGMAVGDASVSYDLCDSCLWRAIESINGVIERIKEEIKNEPF